MISPIQSVPQGIVTSIAPVTAEPSSPTEFRDLLTNSMTALDQQQRDATTAVNQFLAGEGGELHSVALQQQRAGLSLDLFLQVRNKVISAYQEVMKMQM